MKGTVRDAGRRPGSKVSAPLPLLGYAIDSVGHVQEQRALTLARAALGFAIASVALSIVVIVGILVEMAHPATGKRHNDSDAILGLMLFLCPLCMLLGILLGTITRKTRTGKAALLLSLAPLAVTLLAFLATMLVAFFAGISRGLKT